MKLPTATIIAPTKLTDYLLVWRAKDDKSIWLATAGYTIENWQALSHDLRKLIVEAEAVPIEQTRFGQMFEIRGGLTGPNGRILAIRSFWMTEFETQQTKFVTLYPDKEHRDEI